MGKYRIVFWYIFTNDAHTNQVISRELPSENTMTGIMCADGVERNLWKCDGQFVTKIRQSKKDQHLVFEIFKKDGKYGPIKKATFLKVKPKIKKF